ncbi:hypothetical protein BH11MYX4_BH11MYX4_33650 [soil metagenome]
MARDLETDVLQRWIEPLGLVLMLILALVFALLVVRRHGRAEQRRLARAERKHPFAAPLRTVISFGTAFASVLLFVRIGREVVEGETSRIDTDVALAIHGVDNVVMDTAMPAFTFMGSPYAVIPVAALVLGWALGKRDHRASLVLVLVLTMTEVLNVVLKHTFVRARPTLFQIHQLDSYSFPSGHAMAAVACYGIMGVVVARLAPRHRRLLVITLPAFVFLIGYSRVFLGYHWPTDVLAGFAAGGFLVLAGAITLDGVPTASAGPGAGKPQSSM